MTRTERVSTWVCAALFCLCVGYGLAAVHVLPEPVRGQIGWTLTGVSAAAAIVFVGMALRAGWARPGRHR